jgi:hypothetical protein
MEDCRTLIHGAAECPTALELRYDLATTCLWLSVCTCCSVMTALLHQDQLSRRPQSFFPFLRLSPRRQMNRPLPPLKLRNNCKHCLAEYPIAPVVQEFTETCRLYQQQGYRAATMKMLVMPLEARKRTWGDVRKPALAGRWRSVCNYHVGRWDHFLEVLPPPNRFLVPERGSLRREGCNIHGLLWNSTSSENLQIIWEFAESLQKLENQEG